MSAIHPTHDERSSLLVVDPSATAQRDAGHLLVHDAAKCDARVRAAGGCRDGLSNWSRILRRRPRCLQGIECSTSNDALCIVARALASG